MAESQSHKNEPTQVTPQGARIPLPRRDVVMGDLMSATRRKPEPDEDHGDSDAGSAEGEG